MIFYCLIMYCYWSCYCATSGYTSFYLLDRGISNSAIGLIIALACMTAVILEPLIAGYADREKTLNLKPIILLILAAVGLLLVGLNLNYSGPILLTGILYAGTIIVLHLLSPLINSLGTTAINQGEKINFGAARAIGSGAYAVAAFVLGKILTQAGSRWQPVLTLMIYALLALAVFSFPFQQNKSLRAARTRTESGKGIIGFFCNYPAFGIAVIGAALICIAQMSISSFLYQLIVSRGGDSSTLGTAQFIGAASELPIMFGFAGLMKRKPASFWLILSGFGYILRFVVLFMTRTQGGIYVAQATQLLCWGMMQVAYVYYVNSIMEQEDAIKGQAYFAMTVTIGSMLGSAVGGFMTDLFGVNSIIRLALVLGIVGTAVMTAGIRGSVRRKLQAENR